MITKHKQKTQHEAKVSNFLLTITSEIIVSVRNELHDNQVIRWSGCNIDDKLFPSSKINMKMQIRLQQATKLRLSKVCVQLP